MGLGSSATPVDQPPVMERPRREASHQSRRRFWNVFLGPVQDEDFVTQVNEPREVAGAAAEERSGLVLFSHQGLFSTHVPDVVLVPCAVDRLARLGSPW